MTTEVEALKKQLEKLQMERDAAANKRATVTLDVVKAYQEELKLLQKRLDDETAMRQKLEAELETMRRSVVPAQQQQTASQLTAAEPPNTETQELLDWLKKFKQQQELEQSQEQKSTGGEPSPVGRSTSGTVSFRRVTNFHQLSIEEATRVIYNELIPACENEGVMLSRYGNHDATGSLCDVQDYNRKKDSRQLFDVGRIKKAFESIPTMFQDPSIFQRSSSYGLKHYVERHPCQNEYITNGDFIVAMLLRGYKAKFGENNEPLSVNCGFFM